MEQPLDLELRADGSTIDEFEFGRETVTLLQPGLHRIDIEPRGKGADIARNLSMSSRQLSLQEAELFQDAELYATRSKLTGKLEDINNSLSRWQRVDDSFAIARTYLKQGDAFLSRPNPLDARTAYEEALRICGQVPDLRCRAEAANNSGYASFLIGDLANASRRLRQAAQDWRRLSMPVFEGRTLNNLGMMFRQSGDFGEAILALRSARRMLVQRDPIVYGQVLNNLGLCYQSVFEDEKAIAYFKSAREVLAAHQQRTARLQINLARSYLQFGKPNLSIAALHAVLGHAATTQNVAVRGDALANLGQALLAVARVDESRLRLGEALDLERKAGSKRGQAIALHHLGVAALRSGDEPTARKYLTEAIQILRDTGLRDELSETTSTLAELEFRAGNRAAARRLAREAISLVEMIRVDIPTPNLRATYYARKRRMFDLLMEIELENQRPSSAAQALLISEQCRARAVLDLVTAGAITGVVPRRLEAGRTRLRRQIELLSSRMSELNGVGDEAGGREGDTAMRDELRRRAVLLLADEEQVEAEIRNAVKASALGQPLGSIGQIQSALPGDTAILEFYVGERSSYLWVIQSHGIRFFRLPRHATLDGLASRTCSRFGAILDRRRSPDLQATFAADLRQLADVLLRPLENVRLPSRLIVIPDDLLHYVPFAALQPSWAREPLGLTFELIQAPSAAFLLASKAPRPVGAFPASFLAVADPVFSPDDPRVSAASSYQAQNGFARLPFKDEILQVESLLPPPRVRVLEAFDASPKNLMNAGPSRFAVLHFSTHASIDERLPELSRIALSLVDRQGRSVPGYLHPYDFADFGLNRSIVVLASCDTALGRRVPGEGFLGFSNELFSAGASQLVLTTTNVDAESSSAFFAEVYRRFFGSRGAGMESALRSARRALASSDRWSDPYYWAPYVLAGAPTCTQ